LFCKAALPALSPHRRAAREDLRRYLALVPQADDADGIGTELAELGGELPRVN